MKILLKHVGNLTASVFKHISLGTSPAFNLGLHIPSNFQSSYYLYLVLSNISFQNVKMVFCFIVQTALWEEY